LDTDRLNRWLTLGANIGVLIGIAFLAIEIRQNAEMIRAQITQSRAETAIAISGMTVNSEYMPGIRIKVRDGIKLTEEEKLRYRTFIRAILRNQDNYLQQYNQGLIPDHIPRALAGAIRSIIAESPLALDYWEQTRSAFSDDFIAFVDDVIAKSKPGSN
jgi:hypothetical protein